MSVVCGTGGFTGPKPGDPDSNIILSAVPAFGGIDIAWSFPALNPHAVAHFKLYRSTSGTEGTGVLHKVLNGNSFYDKANTTTEYFYWVSVVSANDGNESELVGPVSSIARLAIEDLIAAMTARIEEGMLATSLREEIQEIPSLNTKILSEQAARIAEYDGLMEALNQMNYTVEGTAGLIEEETLERITANDALVGQINVWAAKANENSAMVLSEQTARANADKALASQIDTIRAANVPTFYQDAAPDPEDGKIEENSIWINTTEPEEDNTKPEYPVKQWVNGSWVPVKGDTLAGTHAAIQAESMARVSGTDALSKEVRTLESSLGRKTRTFFQKAKPIAENVGDLWIDTDNNNQMYYWGGTEKGWVDGWDQRLRSLTKDLGTAINDAKDAMAEAKTARAMADNKIRTFYQENAPTGLNDTTDTGDLWFDTNDDMAYRWTGSEWKIVEDNAIASALQAGQHAQSTADGKITTFYTEGPKGPQAEGFGDIWFDTNDKNHMYIWSGDVWVDARDSDIALGASRNRVFYQGSPGPVGENVGDLWYNIDEDDKAYRWDGERWKSLNLYTGNQVRATVQTNNRTMIGYCEINGEIDTKHETSDRCLAAGGKWVPARSLAQSVKTVQIQGSDGELVSVENKMKAYEDNLGNLNAKAVTLLDVDGTIGGFGVFNDGEAVEAGFNVNTFWIGESGSGKVYPFMVNALGETVIDEGVISSLTIGKLRSEDNSLAFNKGKLRADLIEADKLDVKSAAKFSGDVSSDDFVAGKSGWQILQSGYVEFNNAVIRGNVDLQSITVNGELPVAGTILDALDGEVYDSSHTMGGSSYANTVTRSDSTSFSNVPEGSRLSYSYAGNLKVGVSGRSGGSSINETYDSSTGDYSWDYQYESDLPQPASFYSKITTGETWAGNPWIRGYYWTLNRYSYSSSISSTRFRANVSLTFKLFIDGKEEVTETEHKNIDFTLRSTWSGSSNTRGSVTTYTDSDDVELNVPLSTGLVYKYPSFRTTTNVKIEVSIAVSNVRCTGNSPSASDRQMVRAITQAGFSGELSRLG